MSSFSDMRYFLSISFHHSLGNSKYKLLYDSWLVSEYMGLQYAPPKLPNLKI